MGTKLEIFYSQGFYQKIIFFFLFYGTVSLYKITTSSLVVECK